MLPTAVTEQALPGFHLVRHPLADLKVSALRDRETPPPEFRRLLQELSQLVAYEALRGHVEAGLLDSHYMAPLFNIVMTNNNILKFIIIKGVNF